MSHDHVTSPVATWHSFSYEKKGQYSPSTEPLNVYQFLIGQRRVPSFFHSTGRPPLSHEASTVIWRLLRKGCPSVVWLVEWAVWPATGPCGLCSDCVAFWNCFWTHKHTHTQLAVRRLLYSMFCRILDFVLTALINTRNNITVSANIMLKVL